MKKILFYFLKQYTRTEPGRLEVHSILNEQVENEYSEQNTYGNVYNSFIEFILSNKFVTKLIKEDDQPSIDMIKSGIIKSFDDSVYYIKNDIQNTSEM
jgi:hypothetical protein